MPANSVSIADYLEFTVALDDDVVTMEARTGEFWSRRQNDQQTKPNGHKAFSLFRSSEGPSPIEDQDTKDQECEDDDDDDWLSDCNKDIEYVMDEEWDLTFKFAPDSPSSVTADTIGKFICEVAKWCDQCAKEPLSWDAVRVNARRLSGLARQFKEDTYREMLQSSNSDIILAWIESNQATEPRCPFHVIYSVHTGGEAIFPWIRCGEYGKTSQHI